MLERKKTTLLYVGCCHTDLTIQCKQGGGARMNQYITGTVIKELRNRYDITQMELGEKLGVSAKTISKWETGVSLR